MDQQNKGYPQNPPQYHSPAPGNQGYYQQPSYPPQQQYQPPQQYQQQGTNYHLPTTDIKVTIKLFEEALRNKGSL